MHPHTPPPPPSRAPTPTLFLTPKTSCVCLRVFWIFRCVRFDGRLFLPRSAHGPPPPKPYLLNKRASCVFARQSSKKSGIYVIYFVCLSVCLLGLHLLFIYQSGVFFPGTFWFHFLVVLSNHTIVSYRIVLHAHKFRSRFVSFRSVLFLSISCGIGTGISFSTFKLSPVTGHPTITTRMRPHP
jgi:hypothetical protein